MRNGKHVLPVSRHMEVSKMIETDVYIFLIGVGIGLVFQSVFNLSMEWRKNKREKIWDEILDKSRTRAQKVMDENDK